MKRIFVVELTKLGDLVSSLPIVTALKESFPMSSITLMVQAEHSRLLSLVSEIDGILSSTSGRGLRSVLKDICRVRAGKFDLVISASPSVRHGVFVLLSGARYQYGYLEYTQAKVIHLQPHRVRSLGFRLVSQVDHLPLNIADRVDRLCQGLGLRIPKRTPALGFLKNGSVAGFKPPQPISITNDSSYVVVHPFAGWEYRTWPLINFHKLVTRILEWSTHQIVIIGGDGDRDHLHELVRALAQDPRVTFAVGLPLDDLALLIARAAFYIGGDSGPLHLAAAVGTPSVGLFGPAPPELTGPPVSTNSYLYKKVECSPCDQRECVRKWAPCMTLISVDEVFDKVVQARQTGLESSPRRAAWLTDSLRDRRSS